MKFHSALLLSGAVGGHASAIARNAATDSCPVVVKTVKLSWIELKEFTVAETWSWEESKSMIGNSKPDASQVYQGLNNTYGSGSGYSVKPSTTTSNSYSATGGPYVNGTITGSVRSGQASPTGVLNAASTSSSATASASASATGVCSSPRVRVEWRNLSDDQRDAYVAAIKCLMNKPSSGSDAFPGSRNLYEDLTSLHQQLTPVVHGNGAFLVWHRYFVNVYEDLLRDQCAYAEPFPWWDETQDSGAFASAPMFTSRWLGELPAGVDGQGVCITETGFGAYEPNIGPNDAIDNPHCLSRAVDESMTQNTNQDWVDNCNGAQNYNDFRSCNELTYHAYGHNGIGAVMANVYASPADPSFFLHHGFIDRNYKVWQNGGSTRNYEIGGPNASGGTTSPTDTLTSYGLRPDATIADVLNTEGGYLCYVYDKE